MLLWPTGPCSTSKWDLAPDYGAWAACMQQLHSEQKLQQMDGLVCPNGKSLSFGRVHFENKFRFFPSNLQLSVFSCPCPFITWLYGIFSLQPEMDICLEIRGPAARDRKHPKPPLCQWGQVGSIADKKQQHEEVQEYQQNRTTSAKHNNTYLLRRCRTG